jgi:hypothetical protein
VKFFVVLLKVNEEKSRIQIRNPVWGGSVDLDPYQNVTDPEHGWQVLLQLLIGCLVFLAGQAPGYCGHQAKQGLASRHRVQGEKLASYPVIYSIIKSMWIRIQNYYVLTFYRLSDVHYVCKVWISLSYRNAKVDILRNLWSSVVGWGGAQRQVLRVNPKKTGQNL